MSVQRVSGTCLKGVWRGLELSGRFLEGILRVSGGFSEGVWKVSDWCLLGIKRVSVSFKEDVWKMSKFLELKFFGHKFLLDTNFWTQINL